MVRENGEQPEIPDIVEHIWQWFCRLNRRRGFTQGGPLPLSPETIAAFFSLERMEVRAWEWQALESMDDAFLEASLERISGDNGKGEASTPASVAASFRSLIGKQKKKPKKQRANPA